MSPTPDYRSRPPFLEKGDPGVTPAGWYTVADGRELWWDGDAWVVVPPTNTGPLSGYPQFMVSTSQVRSDNTFHLILTIFTCGAWAPIWFIVWVVNRYSEDQSSTRLH